MVCVTTVLSGKQVFLTEGRGGSKVYKTGRTEECNYVKGANTAVQMIVTRNVSRNNATLLLKRLF